MNWASIILSPLVVKILDWLFKTPAQANAQAAKFGDFSFPRSKYGDPMPILWGTVKQKSPLTMWFGDYVPRPIKKKVSTGLFSSKKVIVGWKNYVGMDCGLGIGPGHKITKIWANNKLAWSGSVNTDTSFSINQPNLFGGDEQQGGFAGTVSFYTGGDSPNQNAYMQRVLNPDVPAYNGVCHMVLEGFYIGTTTQVPVPNVEIQRLTYGLHATYSVMPNGLDVNPLEIGFDVLTQRYGRFGIPQANLEMTSWLRDCQTLYNEGRGMSLLVQSAVTAKDLFTQIMDIADGFMYQEPSTRQIVTKLVRNDYNIATLDVLDESIVSDISGFNKNTWASTFNQCRVTFEDRANDYNDSVSMQTDFANINYQQRVVSTNITANGIKDSTVAGIYCASQLSRANVPLYVATLTCNRKAAKYRPGDVFILNWKPYGLTGMVMRVGKVELGELVKGQVKLTVMQDRYSTSTPIFAPPDPTQWVPVTIQALPVTVRDIFEAPYWFASNAVTAPADTQAIINVLAQGPSSASISYTAQSGQQASMSDASTVLADAPYYGSGLLQSALLATVGAVDGQAGTIILTGVNDTSVLVNNTLTQARDGSSMFRIDDEFFIYAGYTINTDGTVSLNNVQRALLDTAFADHAAGARAFFVGSQDGVIEVYYPLTPSTEYVRLVDKTPVSTLDPSSALIVPVTLSGRLALPAAPDYTTANGSRTPSAALYASSITFAWRERNRKTASLRYYNDATEAAESSTDYQIRTRVNGGAWSGTSFVTGTSTSIIANAVGNLQIEVTTRRNGTTLSRNSDYVTIQVQMPVGSPQTSRYWRIYMPSMNSGDSYLDIRRVWFFNNQVVYNYSGSETTNQSSYYASRTASFAFKNTTWNGSNAEDGWTTATSSVAPQWISIDFGSAVTADAIMMTVDSFNNGARGPQNFQIQTSDDGVNWVNQTSFTPTWTTANNIQPFTLNTFKLLAADGATFLTTPSGDRLRTQ